ncbi:hypothetical protein EI94DRAFT_1703795 [Lactarius quietus]|nr:hypothetical protein EI94DRAFT_1703795 [Lactarius quietus]
MAKMASTCLDHQRFGELVGKFEGKLNSMVVFYWVIFCKRAIVVYIRSVKSGKCWVETSEGMGVVATTRSFAFTLSNAIIYIFTLNSIGECTRYSKFVFTGQHKRHWVGMNGSLQDDWVPSLSEGIILQAGTLLQVLGILFARVDPLNEIGH